MHLIFSAMIFFWVLLAQADQIPTTPQDVINFNVEHHSLEDLYKELRGNDSLNHWQKIKIRMGQTHDQEIKSIPRSIESALGFRFDSITKSRIVRFFRKRPELALFLNQVPKSATTDGTLALSPETFLMIFNEVLERTSLWPWEIFHWMKSTRMMSPKFIEALANILSDQETMLNVRNSHIRGSHSTEYLVMWLQQVLHQKTWSTEFVEAFAKLPPNIFNLVPSNSMRKYIELKVGPLIEGRQRLPVLKSMLRASPEALTLLAKEYLILDHERYEPLIQFTKDHYWQMSDQQKALLFDILKIELLDRPDLARAFNKVWPEFVGATLYQNRILIYDTEPTLPKSEDRVLSFEKFRNQNSLKNRCARLFKAY